MFVTFISTQHSSPVTLPVDFPVNGNDSSAAGKFNKSAIAWMIQNYISYTACELCAVEFKSSGNPNDILWRQDGAMHSSPPSEDENLQHNYKCSCSDCQMKFGSLPVLLEGIATKELKTEEPPCQPSTSQAHSSKRKEMRCGQCDKIFTHRGDLNKHLRMHSGEKPFACSVCNKQFSHTSNLTRHLKVHTGDKPFECVGCGKRFSRKDKMDSHKTSKICKKRSLLKKDTESTD